MIIRTCFFREPERLEGRGGGGECCSSTGYLLVWTLFGGVVYFRNLGLLSLANASTWLVEHYSLGTPVLLLVAGVFQFTSLKYRCLDKCRSPLTFVMGHWQGRNERRQAFRLGLDDGVFGVGCCWALMLLMFIVGLGSLLWMMILAVVMGVEKNARWGRRLSAPLGIVLLVSAVVLLVLASRSSVLVCWMTKQIPSGTMICETIEM